ncbi:primosomal protein N' [Arsukibacterium indicum]|uniref:Replication restart protein PriA n=1 Tax=Arsukibacterium indicum TaxID=2848612 RepID=A0ABS6MNE3_9GAMM|nr:primosomal protein N' [Arsukibacterium indicum]MBV2130065.1 primosomal protein N' [Arsukibacterium indicum]
MSVIRVALPLPLRQHFDYLLSSGQQIQIGCRVRVPFGKRELIGVAWQLDPPDHYPIPQLKPVISVIDADPVLDENLRQLLTFAAEYYHHPLGEVLTAALPALLREGKDLADYQQYAWQLTTAGTSATAADFKRSARQLALWQALQQGPVAAAELYGSHPQTAIKQLEAKGLIEKDVLPLAPFSERGLKQPALQLTADQALAVTAINHAAGRFQSLLLEGVTGSGKTEVYLQAIAPLLDAGRQVLVIVPEIGLTPQTLSRFQSRFQAPVLCWHSNLTNTERLHCWQHTHAGSAAIVIGTRSALFLPFASLGLIIIDEEHDQSLKQQDGFRYHARDLAIKRAAIEQCPILLGSATPSLESLYNCQQQRFVHLSLHNRAAGQAMPRYQLVDLKQQVLQFGLASQTLQYIKQQLQQGMQVMLFLNRRGFAPALSCQECGWLTECHRCSAFTTYHKQSRQLVCHHCGAIKAVPRQCGQCGSARLAPVGQGTEQLEENLQQLFPDIAITRLDRDTTRRKGALASALDSINQSGPRLILGTQMLAKGHHFPFVTLVVIVDVDGALYSSDFRAPEQLGQLLTQVAGRAGRGSNPGTVLLQTHYPEHVLLQDIIHNGYASFARSALLERQHTRLPPYQHLALFRAEALQSAHCQQWLTELADLAKTLPGLELLGPLSCPMEKRAGKYRWQLQLYSNQRPLLHQALNTLLIALQSWPLSRQLKWQLDVDPIDLS